MYVDTDGKAGMAVVIDDSGSINMNTLMKDLIKNGLPSYARPCFIRLTKHIEMTGNRRCYSQFIHRSLFRNIQSEENCFSRRRL